MVTEATKLGHIYSLEKKAMINLDSLDITFPTEVHLVQAMVFPVVMYRGEGNGNTLQYSCLENPKDGGAW